MSAVAYVACPISAGTTKAIRPAGLIKYAVATTNAAHAELRLLSVTPFLAQINVADAFGEPLKF
jgi:hypothetical protein